MFKNRLTVVGITFLCLIFCLPSVASSQRKQIYNIPWSVLNEGGKTEEATSASYRLKDAIGQPVIGTCESASYKAYIGFWTPSPLEEIGIEEVLVSYTRIKRIPNQYVNDWGNNCGSQMFPSNPWSNA